MATVAIGWQVYSVRENPLDLALVALAEFLPLPLLALPAGHLADRLPRRRLWTSMIALDTVVLCGLLAVTAWARTRSGRSSRSRSSRASAARLAHPPSRALMPSLVPQEILVAALAQRSIGFQLDPRRRAGGGWLVVRDRGQSSSTSSGSHSRSSRSRSALAVRSGRMPASDGAADLGDVLAGVRLIRRTRVLFGAISLDLFAVLLGGAVALLPIFAKDILEVGPTGLGPLRAAAPGRRFPLPRSSSPAIRSASVPGRSCSSSSRASARR